MDMEGKEAEDIEMGGANQAVEIRGSTEAVGRRQYLTIGHQGNKVYTLEKIKYRIIIPEFFVLQICKH